MFFFKVFVVGSIPPPIGGVTMHVERLLSVLEKHRYSVRFLPIRGHSIIRFFRDVFWSDVVHLHSSNPYLRLTVSCFCRIFRIPLISTIHGRLGRFRGIRNWADFKSVEWTTFPIVLNEQSFELAVKKNRHVRMISAFLPPMKDEALPGHVEQAVSALKSKCRRVWSTNAFNLSFDVDEKEIYGISDLIRIFCENPDLGLTVSDPTGNYLGYLKSIKIDIPENVLFITEAHSFYEVMKLTDGMIRNTTTDGDALSVKEALWLRKTTLATDVVSRPKGVICYGNLEELSRLLSASALPKPACEDNLSGEADLLKLYIEAASCR